MVHKSGFVSIIGNPNVGKSTLMNELVGERLSIVTNKSQTTRHRIMGILNDAEYQIVFSDTPGVLKPNYKLQESMLHFSVSSLEDADIVLYVTDINEKLTKNQDFIDLVNKLDVPMVVVVNKIDLSNQEILEKHVDLCKETFPKAEVLPISALNKFNTDYILNRIKELLPESEPYFDKDALTDKPMRFFVSEIIREKILLLYDKEVPYSVEVDVEEYKDEENIIRIRAVIYVARDSQKGIIIGHKGQALKKVGMQSRKELEKFLDKKVFLETHVKVNKDWRNNDRALKGFGYNQ